MNDLTPLLLLLIISFACAFTRTNLRLATALVVATWISSIWFAQPHWSISVVGSAILAAIAILLNTPSLRRAFLSGPLLKAFEGMTPQLSETEKIALAAGTVGWEGEIFTGKPDWKQLLDKPVPTLSTEEKAFMDGPVEQLLELYDDWHTSHVLGDLSPEVWDFVKKQRFFGMIIPKKYGGLEFSAFAHSLVIQKIAGVSATLSSTVAVPNSLGPAELLLHYGTEEQKDYYLPRLAVGEEIPCFALTNPNAGSDATSIPDYGIVCKGQFEGKEVLGLKLTFDKRYITLAPVATVIGLAFQLHDPDHLLGPQTDRGITLALLPRATQGLKIGRRHLPLNVPFQNGPLQGKEVFVPMSYLIGGEAMIGHGWRMLVECLSVGRAISLPSTAAGGIKMAAFTTGAYARIRKQFGLPIGRFEGVEEALARIGGYCYSAGALTRMTAAAVDNGEKPAVPSAIAKYHATEMGAAAAKDAMDVHGGKGIILGPKNYLGRCWQGAPISITVEGANILTRSLIIFGQGAVRCHPFVLREMEALAEVDADVRLKKFDALIFAHVGFAVSSASRAFFLGLAHSRFGSVPGAAYTKHFYRKLNRYSAAFALVADTAMLVLGGKLKYKERLSARLGDVLSNIYIASSLLKRFEDDGRPQADQVQLAWAFHDCIFKIQTALDSFLRNFPVRPVAWALRILVFPLGLHEQAPSDRLGHRVASLLLSPSESRDRLCDPVFCSEKGGSPVGLLARALPLVIAAEPIDRKFVKAQKSGVITALDEIAQLEEAVKFGVLTEDERALMQEARELTAQVIAVDDFDSAELAAASSHKKAALKSVA